MPGGPDGRNLYFNVRTREPMSSAADPNGMWLLIDIDQDRATGWEGYDFVVNRRVQGDGISVLEKNTGGWNWTQVADIAFRAEDSSLHLAILRTALGLGGEGTAASIDFKWVDHAQHPGEILDFYVNGDAAPAGRFESHRYWVYRWRADTANHSSSSSDPTTRRLGMSPK